MVHHIWDDFPEIQKGLESVKSIMVSELSVIHPEVKEKIIAYMDAPGKYLRSGLCLLLSQSKTGHIAEGKLYLAAYLETLHLATLIHDDVIDDADSRRGLQVMNKTFSNRIAIYAGDYLLSYANRFLLKAAKLLDVGEEDQALGNNKVIERILAGELAQLMNQFDYEMTMKAYLKQIKGKTALLFALACQVGVWEKGIPKRESRLAYNLGLSIGMAFQISDDLIDYQIDEKNSGKPRMQDIQNGIYSAPFLFAREADYQMVEDFQLDRRKKWSEEELNTFYNRLEQTKAFEKTEQLIRAYLRKMQEQSQKLLTADESEQLVSFLFKIMDRQF
ncbi:polyprenyl synthetase family protein [Streptococcus thoraltensis]|uniref:polyprenyl synthetase family protein n=1 Tax=Streptococcus thoraltensis TaxID=55085 RepID=UPI001F570B95|nr:polyprenyl synthetase family protein [Streptococcus thoraltensis]